MSGKNAFGLAERNVKIGDYNPDVDGLTVDTFDINTGGGIASVDVRSAPLNKANLDEALSGGAFVAPTVSLPLATLPVGTGAATVAMVVTDGTDGKRDWERGRSLCRQMSLGLATASVETSRRLRKRLVRL